MMAAIAGGVLVKKWKWARRGVVAAFLISVSLAPPAARAEAPVRIGLLTCQVDGAVGKILGSFRRLSCTFSRAAAHPLEFYQGEMRRIGLDIGSTRYSDISWAVFALTRPYTPGALEGTYAGISAGVSLGAGLGANVLIGGFDRSFALQPVSVETSRGVNLALGIGKLDLFSAPGYADPPITENVPAPGAAPGPDEAPDTGEPTVIQGVTE